MTMSNRIPTVTDDQIRALRDTAAKGGEWHTVECCDLVLDGHQLGRDTTVDDATTKVASLLHVELPQRPSPDDLRAFTRGRASAEDAASLALNITWRNPAVLADADTWFAYRNALCVLHAEGSNINNDTLHAFCIAAIRFYEHAPFTHADALRWGPAYRGVRSALGE